MSIYLCFFFLKKKSESAKVVVRLTSTWHANAFCTVLGTVAWWSGLQLVVHIGDAKSIGRERMCKMDSHPLPCIDVARKKVGPIHTPVSFSSAP
jgi:hypothetical protein